MLEDLTFKSLGIVNYHETHELMKSHIKKEKFNNEIWLLEHPPIFTLGTAADKNHVLNAKDIPVVQSDRGGEVTYHGPGQLVIYFLLDIKKLNFGPKKLVITIQNLVKDKQMAAFEHTNFWHPMDTLRDKTFLNDLWQSGRAPWKIWQ